MINNNHLEQHGVHQSQIINPYDIGQITSFWAISKEGKISTAFKYNHKKLHTKSDSSFFFGGVNCINLSLFFSPCMSQTEFTVITATMEHLHT